MKIGFAPHGTCGAAHSRQAWRSSAIAGKSIFFSISNIVSCDMYVLYIYITSQPAIFLFQNQGVKQCNLSGSCQLGCFLFHGGTVFRYRSSSLWLPNWFATSDLRCGTVGHLTRHELLKQKRGCETSNWRHPKKNAHWLCLWTFNSILCLSGIPLKQKNGKKPRQKWRNYKKNAWIKTWPGRPQPPSEGLMSILSTNRQCEPPTRTQRSTDFLRFPTRLEHLKPLKANKLRMATPTDYIVFLNWFL